MADSYSHVKGGKLKFKGKKDKSHKKQKRKRKREDDSNDGHDEDTLRHGGWWDVKTFDNITGAVAIEFEPMTYVETLDNGLFKLGPARDIGQGPDPIEILTGIPVTETKIAFKSGYDKYLSVEGSGKLTARADAIGSREQWEPVFQDGKLALLGCNNCFMSRNEAGEVACRAKTAGPNEMLQIRSCSQKDKTSTEEDGPKEMKGKTKEVEVNYIKKFQSYDMMRLKVNPEDRTTLKKARTDGTFHEALLDRREKMKSDRYCK